MSRALSLRQNRCPLGIVHVSDDLKRLAVGIVTPKPQASSFTAQPQAPATMMEDVPRRRLRLGVKRRNGAAINDPWISCHPAGVRFLAAERSAWLVVGFRAEMGARAIRRDHKVPRAT